MQLLALHKPLLTTSTILTGETSLDMEEKIKLAIITKEKIQQFLAKSGGSYLHTVNGLL